MFALKWFSIDILLFPSNPTMKQFSLLFWQFYKLFGAKKETSSFAPSVLLALWFYEYEISLLFKKITLGQKLCQLVLLKE